MEKLGVMEAQFGAAEELIHRHRRRSPGAVFTECVQVDCATSGVPLRVYWRGRVWKIAATPQRWFARRRWWEEEPRVAAGSVFCCVEEEMWRLQLRLGAGPLHTLDVAHRVDTGAWRVAYVHPYVAEI